MAKDYMKTYRKLANRYLGERRGVLLAETPGDPGPPEGSDAWLLMSILTVQGDGEKAELADILAASDAINHTILLPAELEGGFARLQGLGFLTLDGATCSVTASGREAWQKAGGKGASLSRQWKAARKITGAPESSS